MITIPVSRPARARAIMVGVGVATVLVARFVPAELGLWHDLLMALGLVSGGIGAATIVQAPKLGGP